MNIQNLWQAVTAKDCLLAILFFGSLFVAATVLIQISACSLCMTQRLFMAAGVLTIAISLLHDRVPWAYVIVSGLFFTGGIAVALRQLWIQYVPGAAANCGPGIDFLIANEYPMSSVIRTMLMGSGDCAAPSLIPLLALCGFLALMTLLGLHVLKRSPN